MNDMVAFHIQIAGVDYKFRIDLNDDTEQAIKDLHLAARLAEDTIRLRRREARGELTEHDKIRLDRGVLSS